MTTPKKAYNFAVLDPRPTPEAKALNEEVFNSGPVFGVEVTVTALAAKCIQNLDPQHTGGQVGRAAIEDALVCELPLQGTTIATVRADLDSIGSMVVLALRLLGQELSEDAIGRIQAIAASDAWDRGKWQPKPLPKVGDPLQMDEGSPELAGIARLISDFKRPLTDRLTLMESYLLTGSCAGLEESIRLLRKERDESIAASNVELAASRIATVVSTHRGGMGLGYCLAPVAVALNPAFRVQGGEPHAKFTIAQFSPGFVDLVAVKNELVALEPGWGGSPTIIGSPQGTSSKLSLEQVVEVVSRHLLK